MNTLSAFQKEINNIKPGDSKLKELQSCIQSHHFMASREKVETVTAAIKLKDKTSLEGKV